MERDSMKMATEHVWSSLKKHTWALAGVECYQQLPQVEPGTTGAVFTRASFEHVPLSCKIFCVPDLGLGLLFTIL